MVCGQLCVCPTRGRRLPLPVAPPLRGPHQWLQEIVGANLLGSLLGARAAIRQMLTQPEGGKVRGSASPLGSQQLVPLSCTVSRLFVALCACSLRNRTQDHSALWYALPLRQVFLMDGSGSRGNPTPGNAAYGATKRALVHLKDTLAAEVASSSVSVHILSPGESGCSGRCGCASADCQQSHAAAASGVTCLWATPSLQCTTRELVALIARAGLVSTDLLLQYATTPRAGAPHCCSPLCD